MTVVLFLQFAVCYLDMCLWNTNIAPAFPQAPRWWLRCPRLPMMTSLWMSQWARLHGRNTPSQARNSLKLSFIIFAGLTHGIPMHPHWHRDRRSRRWWWHLCLAWWCAGFIRFNQCLVSNYVAAYCCIILLLKNYVAEWKYKALWVLLQWDKMKFTNECTMSVRHAWM